MAAILSEVFGTHDVRPVPSSQFRALTGAWLLAPGY
jgi:hypothetical protein